MKISNQMLFFIFDEKFEVGELDGVTVIVEVKGVVWSEVDPARDVRVPGSSDVNETDVCSPRGVWDDGVGEEDVDFTTDSPKTVEILDACAAFKVAEHGAADAGGGDIAVPGQPWKIEPSAKVADTVPQ